MASQQNGQPFRGQNTNPYGSPEPNRYGGYIPPRSQSLRQESNFDTGDDPSYAPGQDPYPVNSRGYRTGSNASTQNEELFMGTPSASGGNTFYSGGGYQQHYAAPLPPLPASQPLYNPQEYVRVPLPQSTPVYSAASPTYQSSYQPYIPSAYQGSNFTQLPSHGSQPSSSPYVTPTSSYAGPPQSPPVPSRPFEQPFNRRLSQVSTSSAYSYPYQQPEPPYRSSYSPQIAGPNALPPRSSAYTPPVPPPPPFSPSQDAFPSNHSTPGPAQSYPYGSTSPRSPTSSLFGSRTSSLHQVSTLSNYPGGLTHTPDINATLHAASPRPYLDRSLPASPGPTPPQHYPQRMDTMNRHPQARPLPGPPPETPDIDSHSDYFGQRIGSNNDSSDDAYGNDHLMEEVEAAFMGRSLSSATRGQSPRVERINYQSPINEVEEPPPLFSGPSHGTIAPDTNHTHTNGVGVHSDSLDPNFGAYSDESDAEARAGLEAMRMAEEQEAAEQSRRHSANNSVSRAQGSQRSSQTDHRQPELSSDSDNPLGMTAYDMSLPGHYGYSEYGNQFMQSIPHPSSHPNLSEYGESNNYYTNTGSLRQSNPSSEALEMPRAEYLQSDEEALHPFPTLGARVDTGGTGGLSEPNAHARRLSFEDGDEATLYDSEYGQQSGATAGSIRESIRHSSSYHSRTGSRPLPRVPASPMDSEYLRQQRQADQFGRPSYPLAPDEYNHNHSSIESTIHKAYSIGSHTASPQVMAPGRSMTDAEQRRKHQHLAGIRTSGVYDRSSGPDTGVTSAGKLGDMDLPAIPLGRRKKFIPAKLSSNDYKRCQEPWALSSILAWIKEMTEGEADLKEQAIVDGIVQLFTNKVPTMNTADAETLSAQVVSAMFAAGALIKEEEWVKFGVEPMNGVLFQITGTGCYSSRVHSLTIPGRCYSHHCMRTLKKINLQTYVLEPQRKDADWATFYNVKKEDLEKVSPKEVLRQNNLHEIVTTEDLFMDQMNILRMLYRDGLAKSQGSIINPKRIEGFLNDVFGKVEAIKQVNEDYLLAQLKYRQEEQGPWITGFADIFREWIRKAKQPYTEYAANFPHATLLVRREAEANILFQQFLNQVQQNERSGRLGWDTFLKAPITRLQRYSLLLSTVYGNTVQDSEEKNNLLIAIEEIKVVTLECDARVAEMSKSVDLADLAGRLILRPEMDKVKLNLTHLGRQVIFQGDLQRRGANKVSWLDTHAILFDHYLVLAKPDHRRDETTGLKRDIYDVSKLPIPMDLLVLESSNDEPVIKSSVKGIAAVSTVTSRAHTPQESRLGRTISNQNSSGGPGTLVHKNTDSSISSVGTGGTNKGTITTTVLDSPNERIMYPFRIKHLGKTDTYVLYASTSQNRQDWCDKIVDAKTRHAASLFAQNAEPFRLRVMADTAFAYDGQSGIAKSAVIRGTPLDRAVREVEKAYDGLKANPVCRAQVNCATAFNQPYGKKLVAVGTDYGVYISDYNNPRGWTRAIPSTRVTQIAVLEEFSLFLLISDRSLVAYHLDTVCPVGGATNATMDSSSRRAPQKLSGSRDVGFFATGRMKDRTLVFYKKREGISSTFKVLEPVYQKSAVSTKNRFGIKKGTTDFFRDFDEFYIPSETYAINPFSSSLAIATARGFEVLTLDKKIPFSIPDLKPPDCASIAARIRDQKPLGMFRLSDSEFLLVFEDVGIYVNKHGDVSRAVVMEFVGRAKQAVLYHGTYLVLVDIGAGFVEVRNAINGRLRQVVSGRDVRLLDDGVNGGTVKICMQHPELERCQIVLEMIVNEGLKE